MTIQNPKSRRDEVAQSAMKIQNQAAGFVTAGGASSRMGSDKALLDIGGKPMIERVVAAIAPAVSSVSIIANNDDYNILGLPIFRDEYIGIGPLEAIRTAIANAESHRVVLAGCDLPFVTTELFSFLLGIEGDYQAIVPVGPDARLEPLCAVYSVEALSAVTSLIQSGERKLRLLFDRVPTRLVSFKEISHLPGAQVFFQNINTPEEHRRATEIAAWLERLSDCR